MNFISAREINYQFRERLNTVHLSDRRDSSLKPEKNEIAVKDGWSICICADPSPVLLNAAKDLQDYFFTSMNVSVLLKKSSKLSDIAAKEKDCIILADKKTLAGYGKKLKVERSYRLITGNSKIIVCASDDRGAAQGSFYIEDLMNLREAPFMENCDTVREPVFSPRMAHSGWGIDQFPDQHLNAMAHSGIDSVLLFVKSMNRTTSGYLDFNDLIKRAASYGLDVYFYSYIKSRKHPEEKDAEEYYENSYGELFKACPGAKGIIFVGESCEFPSKDPKTSGVLFGDTPKDGLPSSKPGPGWWPCYDYPLWLNMIKKTVRKHSPSADIVFWTYNWGWAPEEDRIKLINSMPQDITLMVTFEMFEQIRHGNVVNTCVDYTASFPGPGKYFTSEAEAAKKRNIKLYTMSNTGGLTWDFGTIPYEPVPLQWDKRCKELLKANKKWGLSGLMESHHYGWVPSFVSEMIKARYWTPSEDAESVLEKIAKRDFGKASPLAIKAWELWSEAMQHYIPTNEDQYGPCRVGPSYPFLLHPDISKTFGERELPLPSVEYAHFGSWIVKTFYHPFEDARQSTGAMRLDMETESFTTMKKIWAEGVKSLEKAVATLSGSKRENAEKLLLLGLFVEKNLTTVINAKHWLKLNQQLVCEGNPIKAGKLVDQIEKIAEAELENVKATIPITERDSRLGWEPSMEYMTDPAHLEWKIKQLRSIIDGEIPKYRASLKLSLSK